MDRSEAQVHRPGQGGMSSPRHFDLAASREGLAAAAYVGGHRSTEMAGRVYVSPQADSAEAALRARAREDRFQPGTEPGTGIELEPWAAILSQDLQRTRRDSNPRLLPPEGSALSN